MNRRDFLTNAGLGLTGVALSPESLFAAHPRQEQSYLCMAEDGRICSYKNFTTPIIPASTVKVMTACLLIRAIREYDIDLHQPAIPITNKKFNPDERLFNDLDPCLTTALKTCQLISPFEALQISLLFSANNVAVSIAEFVSNLYIGRPSEVYFVERMNHQAKTWNMHDTVFKDCYGIYDERPISTAQDMIILAKKFDDLFPLNQNILSHETITGQQFFNFNNKRYNNTNHLVWSRDFERLLSRANIPKDNVHFKVTGLKTGYLEKAGACLLAVAKIIPPEHLNLKEQKIYTAFFGGANSLNRYLHVLQLLYQAQTRYLSNQLTSHFHPAFNNDQSQIVHVINPYTL